MNELEEAIGKMINAGANIDDIIGVSSDPDFPVCLQTRFGVMLTRISKYVPEGELLLLNTKTVPLEPTQVAKTMFDPQFIFGPEEASQQ